MAFSRTFDSLKQPLPNTALNYKIVRPWEDQQLDSPKESISDQKLVISKELSAKRSEKHLMQSSLAHLSNNNQKEESAFAFSTWHNVQNQGVSHDVMSGLWLRPEGKKDPTDKLIFVNFWTDYLLQLSACMQQVWLQKHQTGVTETPQDTAHNKACGKKRADIASLPKLKYSCAGCQRAYTTQGGFNRHGCLVPGGHRSPKTFSCKTCGKEYCSLGALKMHIRTHTLPCKCLICGKAFSRPWLLQGHIRTHTGEKPWSCEHCERCFADRSNLRAHLQTHNYHKKFACTHCGRTFGRASLLQKHQLLDSTCTKDKMNRPAN